MAVAAVVTLSVATAVVVLGRPTPAGAVTATTGQVITVRTTSSTATSGVLEAWQKQSNQSYRRVYGPIPAWVGSAGVGATREGLARTPAGFFRLSESFGTAANPGSGLPYRQVDGNDWWVSDVASPAYNTYQRCAPGTCPFDESVSERLATIPVYKYATVIDYNRNPVVAGAGSAFFLHLSNGRPTGGCVAIAETHLVWLMRWLRLASTPMISIGVGSAATAPIANANAIAALHNPTGRFEQLLAPAPGRIRVIGWARDPDRPTWSIRVHVYADNRGIASIGTTEGTNRFDATLALARGSYTVCLYAINIGVGTINPLLGCRAVTVP
ncbi:MAG TPA: L,D-transpeptidase family protein [Mycobacteriales bacterium]